MGSSDAWYLTCLGNVAFFTAQTPSNEFAIWVTDGTTAGTRKFMELGVNQFGVALRVKDFISAGKHLFFSVEGGDLWKSDGTEAGTVQVKDALGDGLKTPQLLGESNGKVIFNAETADHGRELWVTDGTETGTALLKDIHPGTAGASAPAVPGAPHIAAVGEGPVEGGFDGNQASSGTQTFRCLRLGRCRLPLAAALRWSAPFVCEYDDFV